MSDERTLQRLQSHFDARLSSLVPPDRLVHQVLAIPDVHRPVTRRLSGRWVGRPLGFAFATLLLLLAAVVVALMAGAFRDRTPPPPVGPGAAGLTAFGDAGLRLLDLDGTAAPLECDGCSPAILDAAWAPDGHRVAIALGCIGRCTDDARTWGIRVVDITAERSELVVPGDGGGIVDGAPLSASFRALDWSPDSDRLAYGRLGGGIFVRDLRTGESRRISDLDVDSISWSSDGATLAVSTTRGRIVLVPLDGAPLKDLGAGSQPDWSPDLRAIAYRLPCEVWVMSPDGADPRRLATFEPSAWGGGGARCEPPVRAIRTLGPVWSPNGTELAVVFSNALFRMSADGTQVVDVESPITRSLGGIGMGVEWTPAGISR